MSIIWIAILAVDAFTTKAYPYTISIIVLSATWTFGIFATS